MAARSSFHPSDVMVVPMPDEAAEEGDFRRGPPRSRSVDLLVEFGETERRRSKLRRRRGSSLAGSGNRYLFHRAETRYDGRLSCSLTDGTGLDFSGRVSRLWSSLKL